MWGICRNIKPNLVLEEVMSIRRTFRLATLLAPLLLFALLSALPLYSERLSLALCGHPVARIVPKERLNVFDYVAIDSLRAKAIVFSHGKAMGWIYQPMVGLPRFVFFSHTPTFEVYGFDPWFDIRLQVAWFCRWCLLPIQAVLLLVWLRSRKKQVV